MGLRPDAIEVPLVSDLAGVFSRVSVFPLTMGLRVATLMDR